VIELLLLIVFAVGVAVGIAIARYYLFKEHVEEVEYMEDWYEEHCLPIKAREEDE